MLIQNKSLLSLVSFMLVLAVMYFYSSTSYKAKLLENKEITLSIIDNSIAALEASDALVSNCSDAYSEVAICFSDSCNLNRSAKRLSELELEKKQIQVKLRGITEEMDIIIAKKQSLQN